MIHGISNLTLFSLRPGVISTGPEGLNDHGGLLIGSTKKLRYAQQINQSIVNQSCCNFIKLATSTQNCIISELCGINFGPLVKRVVLP
jgi:hypothetical protein